MKPPVKKTAILLTALSVFFGCTALTLAKRPFDHMRMVSYFAHKAPSDLSKQNDNVDRHYRKEVASKFEELMVEQSSYLVESHSLLSDLRSKWAALADELAKEEPEAKKTQLIQDEILAVDSQLTEKRLEHIVAMDDVALSSHRHRL